MAGIEVECRSDTKVDRLAGGIKKADTFGHARKMQDRSGGRGAALRRRSRTEGKSNRAEAKPEPEKKVAPSLRSTELRAVRRG